jgi:hypothetical protein
MLAEIFMLQLEAATRVAEEAAATSSSSRFIPITLLGGEGVVTGRLAPNLQHLPSEAVLPWL